MVTTNGPSFPNPGAGGGPPPLPKPIRADAPRPARPPGESGFDRQLASLFGDSLFGPWLDPGQYLAATRTTRRHGGRIRRLALLALILCVGAATGWLVRAGLSRRGGEEREHIARNLATFLKEGELARAGQFLTLLRGPSPTLDPHDPHLDLMVRGEAALYRYEDADPSRLARIRPYLASTETGSPSAQRVLASLAVASRQERAARLAELETIRTSFDRDPEFHYLVATALEHKGDVTAARLAWNRSLDLGPLWLGHRYEQAWFEASQGNQAALRKLVDSLVRVAPDSAWTRLALQRFASGRSPEPAASSTASPARPASGVTLFYQHFALALANAQSSDVVTTRQDLSQAIAAVNGQAPFVFDAFDWLMAAKATGLARELTGFEAWPRHSEPAAARLARLAESEPQPEENPPAASESKVKSKKQIKKADRTKRKAKARRRK